MQPSPPLIPYKARRTIAPYLYLSPTLFLLAMLMVLPMFIVIRYSLMDKVIMNTHPVFVGFQNYTTLIADETFRISVGNTLYFTVMSVVFHLLIGLTLALLLNSKLIHGRVRSILRVFYIMPWVFTASIIAVIWRLMLDPAGIINYILTTLHITATNIEWLSSSNTALYAVTFINIWAGYPFYMVSLLAGLQGVPLELYEAAVIDGATDIQRFQYITIPQLLPIIISISMLDFIWTMQVFPLIWMTTGGGPIHATEMLSTFTYKLAFTKYKFSLASASAIIVLLLSLTVAVFYVRHQTTRD
ncbi:sugar ABC transporter permease [candidate division KSB3 bacterium]|uniref:Sugar ABC transporter permease n=1 Tax=candidate division KSB3 bacterium TaxID=2044937 RepID=A0A2G6E5I3_9BACT|nr:MAG: sugar ABC transporter permease [candidate division KSB3 bacterium]PIE29857.1 MAG: sugar ABC transporter permease [candidate division KSB3 bacterium]